MRSTKRLKSTRSLATQRPDEYPPLLALAFHNLGHIQRKLDAFQAASDSLQEALKLYRALAEENPADYLPDLVLTLASLGDVQNDLSAYEAAHNSLSEALKIYGDLATRRPEAYRHEILMTLGKLGTIEVALEKPKAALASFRKALKLCVTLAKETSEDPDRPVHPLTVAEIRALIPTDVRSAFVQFTIAADTGLALILTRKGIECVKLPLLSDIRNRDDLLKRVFPKFLRHIPANSPLRAACIAQAQEHASRAGSGAPFASPAYWAAFEAVGKAW